jgi:beta-glucosidase
MLFHPIPPPFVHHIYFTPSVNDLQILLFLFDKCIDYLHNDTKVYNENVFVVKLGGIMVRKSLFRNAMYLGLALFVFIGSVSGCKQADELVSVEAEVEKTVTKTERGKLSITSLEDIDVAISLMTLEEKAGQLIQAERGGIQLSEIASEGIGSILSGGGSAPSSNDPKGWVDMYTKIAKASRNSSTGIPIVYGIDAVHGHNNVTGATIFPHNMGLGAANNPELVQAIGVATGEEIKATGLHWNFGPAVSIVQDIRWGRSYESYSEDGLRVADLGAAYVKGLESTGILSTTKHFIGDGYTTFGTGQGDFLIDRGDVTVGMDTLLDIYLPAYEKAIAAGTRSIMISFNSIDGEKMHGHDYLLQDVLRQQLGFDA